MCEFSGVVPAPVEVVRERLRATLPGWTLTGDTFWLQGGWWYRGEYTLAPHAEGTLVTHRVINVASAGTRWGVPLANKLFIGFREKTEAAFREGLRRIS